MRDRGTFTDVSVTWQVTTPSAALDITPVDGVLVFTEGQTSASFQITALSDEVSVNHADIEVVLGNKLASFSRNLYRNWWYPFLPLYDIVKSCYVVLTYDNSSSIIVLTQRADYFLLKTFQSIISCHQLPFISIYALTTLMPLCRFPRAMRH